MKKKKSTYSKWRGIRTKLIGAFLIPVALIIILGVLSSTMASRAIVNNYEDSIRNTIQKTGDYYGILFQNVDSKSRELSTDNIIRSYYGGTYANDKIRESDLYNQVMGKVRAVGTNDENIGSTLLIAAYGRGIAVNGNFAAEDYYRYVETAEGRAALEAEDAGIWSGTHPELDELSGVKKEDYGLSVIRRIIGNSMKPIGMIMIDVKTESIQAPLQTIELPEGSICAFVTSDGREITGEGTAEVLAFSGQPFFEEVKGAGEAGLTSIFYDEEEFIYVYAPIKHVGGTINALIPKAAITAQADSIKNLTYLIVAAAIVIAFAVGMILAVGIGRTIHQMNQMVEKAAEGDLTVSIKTRRKDEFSVLANYLGNMFSGIQVLVSGVAHAAERIFHSAQTVSEAAEHMVEVSKEISTVIGKMEQGLGAQTEDAGKCLTKMEILEEKIEVLSGGIAQIGMITNDTEESVETGISVVGELDEKAKETSQITETVLQNISDLKEQTDQIENFSNMIKNIAKQTNLLSLNASIEAARAGESGRGFSVVANEIRKLAEDSMEASNEITRIVKSIGEMTEHTADTARQAEEIVESQTNAIKNTVDTFHTITGQINGLTGNIESITYGIIEIGEAKDITKGAVERITEILGENTETIVKVQTAAQNQVEASEKLSRESEAMASQSKDLEASISKFVIASPESDKA